MPVYINSISFADEYTGSGGGGVPFLMGSVGDKITATINLTIKWNSLNIPVIFTAADKTIRRTDNGSFLDDGFHEDDTFLVTTSVSNNGSKTIDTVTDSVITTVGALVNETSVGVNLYGTTTATALDFYYNLIENTASEDFHSLSDRETEQKFNVTGLPSVYTLGFTTPTNSKGWIQGSASIVRGDSEIAQNYIITHTFFITPLFLASQLGNLQNGLPPSPDYFKDGGALKYICRVDAKFVNVDPDIPHTSSAVATFRRGNTAWFDEFLNGIDPEYTLISIEYEETLSGDTVETIDFSKLTDVTIRINSASGKFTEDGSPLALNFIWLPTLESSYVNTRTNYQEDFKWDRKLFASSSPPTETNGEQWGTDYQVLTRLNATRISATEMEINFRIDMATALQTFFAGRDAQDLNYLIWITPQDETVTTTIGTDRNAIICDVNLMDYDTTDSALLIFDNVQFYEHPDYALAPFSDFKGWPTDTIYAEGTFKVKKSSSILNDFTIAIEAVPADTTKESFELERKTFGTSQYLGPEDIEIITIEEQREFRIPSTYPWNDMNIIRHEVIDDADYAGYKFQYGFKLRHETWVLLENYYRDFIESHTEDWMTYSQRSGWGVYFNIYASVTNSVGNTTDFKHQCSLTIKNYNDIYLNLFDTIETVIQTFVDDTVEGEVDVDGMILQNEYTIVRATFTGPFGSFPAGGYDGYYGILYLDILGAGGIDKIDQCSSEISRVDDSAWLGYTVDSANATLTVVNPTTITLEARLNYNLLDFNNTYILGARLGLKNSGATARVFEDGEAHLWEDGEPALFEDGVGA